MSAFREYVTSTAFRLALSKRQMMVLERVANGCASRQVKAMKVHDDVTAHDLFRKGLLLHYEGHFGLSPEGALVARLCDMASLIELDHAAVRAAA